MGVECDTLTESESEQPERTYTDFFREMCPYYLSIGMTWDQYWKGDCGLAVYFREAEELREKRRNEQAWLQGRYIYDALLRLAPMFRAFGGGEIRPYIEEPYPITEADRARAQKDEEEREVAGIQARMAAIMQSVNKRFERERGDK